LVIQTVAVAVVVQLSKDAGPVTIGCAGIIIAGQGVLAAIHFKLVTYSIRVAVQDAASGAVVECYCERAGVSIVIGRVSIKIARLDICAANDLQLVTHAIAVTITKALAVTASVLGRQLARTIVIRCGRVVIAPHPSSTSSDFILVTDVVGVHIRKTIAAAVTVSQRQSARTAIIRRRGIEVACFRMGAPNNL
jgi:hypothetical protein